MNYYGLQHSDGKFSYVLILIYYFEGTSKQHPYETDIRVPFIIRGPGIQPGTNISSALAGNVDVMPTMLDLAGITHTLEDSIDGKSMKHILMHNDEEATNFRQYFLNEYLNVGKDLYNSHSNIWQDGTTTSDLCQTGSDSVAGPLGPDPNTKEEDCVESDGVGDGNCWMVGSKLVIDHCGNIWIDCEHDYASDSIK